VLSLFTFTVIFLLHVSALNIIFREKIQWHKEWNKQKGFVYYKRSKIDVSQNLCDSYTTKNWFKYLKWECLKVGIFNLKMHNKISVQLMCFTPIFNITYPVSVKKRLWVTQASIMITYCDLSFCDYKNKRSTRATTFSDNPFRTSLVWNGNAICHSCLFLIFPNTETL
jgi:hypothetical protein